LSGQPQDEGTAGLGPRLGTRLRERRREVGRRLADVAQAATVSTGYLSSIEKGASVPSLPVLARLAHALDLSLAEILRTSATERLARGRLSDALGAKRMAAQGSRLQIMRSVARPGEEGRAPVRLGGTDVFVFLYRGALEVDVDGSAFSLGPGDALHCDLPHAMRWRVVGEERAVSIWTGASPPGRQA
jgi:transcriptional regulator with XRE-family HTH domain